MPNNNQFTIIPASTPDGGPPLLIQQLRQTWFKRWATSICRAFCITFILSAPLTEAANSAATSACHAQAENPMENLYCEIKFTREGSHLPSLADFRSNSVNVQRLLLKRPAKALNLTIPAIAALQPTPSRGLQALASVQTGPVNRSTATRPNQHSEASRRKQTIRHTDKHNTSRNWQDCHLLGDNIKCPGELFRLVNNQPNHLLPDHALGAGNQLQLPIRDNRYDTNEIDYLITAYEHYIDKMLSIGLGASTMTFTRFHQIYYDLKAQKVDFRSRFKSMFEYLKADKQTIATPKQLIQSRPASLNACEYLKPELVICDNGKNNWLYLAYDHYSNTHTQ